MFEQENLIQATEQPLNALHCQAALHPSKRCKATILAALTLIDDVTQCWFFEGITVAEVINLSTDEFLDLLEEAQHHINNAQKIIDDYNERSIPCDHQIAWADTSHLFGV